MKIPRFQIFSDLHLEYHSDLGNKFLENIEISAENVILAGDICSLDLMDSVYKAFSKKYKRVFFVLGNHEFYGHTFDTVFTEANRLQKTLNNVYWLNRSIFTIDNLRILGCTLWFRNDPLNIEHQHKLSDFTNITEFETTVYSQNALDISFLEDVMKHGDIVVTHHLPTSKSVMPKFRGSDLTRFFYCDMDSIILDKKPLIWVHGHAHDPFDYIHGETRVICNPYGYHAQTNQNYNYRCYID